MYRAPHLRRGIRQIKMRRAYIALGLLSLLHTGFAREINGRCFTPTLENGWVEAEENAARNSFVGKFRCQPGFVLSGATTVKCRQGRWSVRPDNFPLCAAIGSCDPASVPQIKNGFKKANPRYSNSVYRYSCNKGYRLMGTSTVFCTQSGWSVGEAPVCTRAGCEVDQLMGEEGLKIGRARAVWGGAAFRFSCNAGSVIDGNSFVFCDGKHWNGTKPECLVPPGPPAFSLTVNGVQIENPSLAVGEQVTLTCESSSGNPEPSLALYLGEDQVTSAVAGSSAQYTFTVQTVHDTVHVYCTAHNSLLQYAVKSQVQVLRLKYPASNTYIRGSQLVMSEEYAQFACSSDEADPAPHMEVTITDQDGVNIEINSEKMPKMKGRKGFAARVVFGIHFEEHIKIAEIECKAVNEVGEASSKMTTRVQYAPKTVEISGSTALKHDEEDVVYTCSSSASYPEANIVWNKLVNGNLEKIEEKDTEVETIHTRSGVLKISKFMLHPARSQDETFLLFCIAKIQDLKFEKSSQVLDVAITYPPKRIIIAGPDSVTTGDQAEFNCIVDGGSPVPIPILLVTDQYQNPLAMTPTSNTSVSVMVTKHHQNIYASCFAGNEAGFLQNTKEIVVHYPPSAVYISGPHQVQEGEEGKYECTSASSSPQARIEWKAWSASGEALEFVTDETAEDDKQTVSQLTLLASKTHQLITVQCLASNMAGSADHSISTIVTYSATHLLLTGPATLSANTAATYYCSTDDSLPAATLDWSVTGYNQEDGKIGEEAVETYETALEDGGVQTYSVLTLPEYFSYSPGKLLIRCVAREEPEELNYQIDVDVEDLDMESVDEERAIEKMKDVDTDKIDSRDNKEIQNMKDDKDEENGELSDHEYGLVSNLDKETYGENERLSDEDIEGNTKNDKMVRLVAVGYEDDENYNEDLKDEEQHTADNSDVVHEEDYSYVAAIGKDVDIDYSDENAIDEPSFHKSESKSANVALKLGDRPRQHAEMYLYSSTTKLDLQLVLLLLPAICVWRRRTLG